jgi:hypothetical protein
MRSHRTAQPSHAQARADGGADKPGAYPQNCVLLRTEEADALRAWDPYACWHADGPAEGRAKKQLPAAIVVKGRTAMLKLL